MTKKKVNKMQKTLEDVIDKSLDKIKHNSKDIEDTLGKFLDNENVSITKEEFATIELLLHSMAELNSQLLSLNNVEPPKKAKKSVDLNAVNKRYKNYK